MAGIYTAVVGKIQPPTVRPHTAHGGLLGR